MNRSTHPIDAEEVMAYLDGELAPPRAIEVATHVEQCAECRALDANLRAVSEQAAAWTVESSPDQLEERVVAATKEKWGWKTLALKRLQRPIRRGWVWALAGGLGVVVLLSVIATPNLLKSRTATMHQVFRAPVDLQPYASQPQSSGAAPRFARHASPPVFTGAPGGIIGGLTGPITFVAPPEGTPGQAIGIRHQPAPVPAGPMIIRRAALLLVTGNFENTKAEMQRLLNLHHGYVATMETSNPADGARSLKATLRVPADHLDAFIAALKQLGRVEQESQTGEEVTRQYVDLVARLSNARNTEQRLIEVLRLHTGKVTDILQVEKEMARVREDIERMEAERRSLETQVSFATLDLNVSEEFKARLQAPPSMGGRLRNEFVEGLRSAFDSAFGVALFIAGNGPTLLLWFAILFFPVRFLARRIRAAVKARS
jgi:anti-sigma factor RsiW